ncbi:cupin domain-containing protein [Paenibacillus sp. MER TA 81-3]|nr:cupin domain-containing protein [Paenibacillus sp. MER TA 81-3]
MYPCNCPQCQYSMYYAVNNPLRGFNVNPYDYSWSQYLWPYAWNQRMGNMILKDYGPNPFVVNIDHATKQNDTYRTVLWTGEHLQVALMSINVGDDIGLEVHPHTDQFIRIEEGEGLVRLGPSKDKVDIEQRVNEDYATLVPAGTWHNVINIGNKPLKLYTIYAPPEHPFGTVHPTKAIAMAAEGSNH